MCKVNYSEKNEQQRQLFSTNDYEAMTIRAFELEYARTVQYTYSYVQEEKRKIFDNWSKIKTEYTNSTFPFQPNHLDFDVESTCALHHK